MSLMPPAIPPGAGGGIDPAWINAASTVVGKALAPSSAPSRADTGGFFDFQAPFVVTTGAGSASLSASSSLAWIAAIALGMVLLWKLTKA